VNREPQCRVSAHPTSHRPGVESHGRTAGNSGVNATNDGSAANLVRNAAAPDCKLERSTVAPTPKNAMNSRGTGRALFARHSGGRRMGRKRFGAHSVALGTARKQFAGHSGRLGTASKQFASVSAHSEPTSHVGGPAGAGVGPLGPGWFPLDHALARDSRLQRWQALSVAPRLRVRFPQSTAKRSQVTSS
jgi:hypothetical protein